MNRFFKWAQGLFGRAEQEYSAEYYKGYAYCSRMWTRGVPVKELKEVIEKDKSPDDFNRGFTEALTDLTVKCAQHNIIEVSRPDVLKSRNTLW